MKQWSKEQHKINKMTYIQSFLSLALLVLLSGLFIRSHDIDMNQYVNMTMLLHDLNRENAVFQQESLAIQSLYTTKYEQLLQSKERLATLTQTLESITYSHVFAIELQDYRQLLTQRDKLSKQLIKNQQDMQTIIQTLQQQLATLPDTFTSGTIKHLESLFHLTAIYHAYHSKTAKNKMPHLRQSLASQGWGKHPEINSILNDIDAYIQKSQQNRTTLQKILTLSGENLIHHMQQKAQKTHHQAMQKAKNDNSILYATSTVLTFLIIFVFLQLRRTTTRLQQTILDLKFQQKALDQHAIVTISDQKGRITYANDLFIKRSQYSEHELIGCYHNIVKSNYHDANFYTELWECISSGQTWQGDMCNRCKDGSLFWARTTIVPFINTQQQIERYITIRTDISQHKENEVQLQEYHLKLEEQIRERTLSLQQSVQDLQQEIQTRKGAEKELRQSIAFAEKSVRLKSEFIANMNHELRTPLNAIIGFSDLLREGLVGPLTETQIDYINDIFDSGNRLLHLISDIMDLSKIESGMVEFEPEAVIFNDILQNSLSMIRSKAMNHNIQLYSEVDPSINTVILDVRKVKQALFNLLSNAVKFSSQEGSVTIRVDIEEVESNKPMLRIAIQDTGIGISPKDLPKLFENFVQLDASTDRQFEGTGLGLSLVKQLIELHHGSIDVSSELGVGSCFTFKVPYVTE